jgi:hypothetical protein
MRPDVSTKWKAEGKGVMLALTDILYRVYKIATEAKFYL